MKGKELTGYQIKWIAALLMFVDHAYKIFLPQILKGLSRATGLEEAVCYNLLMLLCGMTAASFFLFAFLAGESCRYTRHKGRYIRNLGLFALLAEPPFQLMLQILNGEELKLHVGLTNVLATLLLGALACFGFEEAAKRWGPWAGGAVLCLCMLAACLLKTDYGEYGVLAVFVCYFVKNQTWRLAALGGVIFLVYGIPLAAKWSSGQGLPVVNALLLLYALGALVILRFYNGKRGGGGKYFFYLFYPSHIFVLVLLYVYTIGPLP